MRTERYPVVWLNGAGPDALVAMLMVLEEWGAEDTYIVSLFLDWNPYAQKRLLAGAAKNAELVKAQEHIVLPLNPGQDFWGNYRDDYFCHPLQVAWQHIGAASYALKHGFRHIVSGIRGSAVDKYPALLQEMLRQPNPGNIPGREPIIWAPLTKYPPTMKVTAELADYYGVDLTHTWSCNQYPPCLTCWKCRERSELGLPQV